MIAPERSPHPIVAQMAPSDEQEPAVLARGRDVVVTAGAGTGKTRTLVARYLSLLAEGLPLRRIVAITFTRKAAREMRNRVRDEIRRYLEERPIWTGKSASAGSRSTASWMRPASAPSTACAPRSCAPTRPRPASIPALRCWTKGQATCCRTQAVDEALAWAADDPEAVVPLCPAGRVRPAAGGSSGCSERLAVNGVLSRADPRPVARWEAGSSAGRQEERRGACLLADPCLADRRPAPWIDRASPQARMTGWRSSGEAPWQPLAGTAAIAGRAPGLPWPALGPDQARGGQPGRLARRQGPACRGSRRP